MDSYSHFRNNNANRAKEQKHPKRIESFTKLSDIDILTAPTIAVNHEVNYKSHNFL